MQVLLKNTRGLWLYVKPALAAWSVRFGYTMPKDEHVINHIKIAYSDEFDSPNTVGDCGADLIRIRPGRSTELNTIAHEFAHLIQRTNSAVFNTMYKRETAIKGYYDNKFEIEAREAGTMAGIFKSCGWLVWEEDYNTDGVASCWPRQVPKVSAWDTWCTKYSHWDYCEYYEEDRHLYSDTEARLTASVRLTIKLYNRTERSYSITKMYHYSL